MAPLWWISSAFRFQRSAKRCPPPGVLQYAVPESTGFGIASFRGEPMQIRINSSHRVAKWPSKLQIRYPKRLGLR